ncbi:MAG: lysoplasmalogenase [Clostridia bacterium]|nr:lysoplasmalogenase [Clostridia bacterium]
MAGALLNNGVFSVFGAAGTLRVLFGAAAALLLAADALLHLTGCYLKLDGLRAPTKVFLVPFILMLHVMIAGASQPLVIVGLILGWIGDILLIPKNNKLCFVLGGASFLIGHGFYIAAAFVRGLPQAAFGSRPVPAAIACAFVLALAVLAYVSLRKKIPGKMKLPAILYLTALSSMAGTMLVSAVGMKAGVTPVLMGGGGLLFAVSDYLLGSGLVRARRIKHNRLWVMLTYILAQLGIALGFALL